MYEAKYQKYLIKNTVRFAEDDEVKANSSPLIANGNVSGAPLFYDGSTLFVDNEDNHTMVIGPTGCKKSRVTVFSTVASIIEAGESAVINDPKGEIYRFTAAKAYDKNANVYVLNFRRPSNSFFWNPLMQAYKMDKLGMEDESLQSVNDFADCVIKPAMEKTNDLYWERTSKAFLISLILMLMKSVPAEYFNLTNLIPFCYEQNRRSLEVVMRNMDPSTTAAFGLHAVLDLEAEKTRSCVYSTLQSVISPFIENKQLLNMFSGNSFDMESLGEKQTLVYIVYPDEKETLNFLVNLFFTQCYETLLAKLSYDGEEKLKVRVNFVLDEFSNLAPISHFANRISESRSKNIRYFLFVQSYGQLKQKYSDCADTILTNCNNWICFGSKETEFLKKLSIICGTETDYNGVCHDLIPASSMQYFRKERAYVEVLIIKQGLHPFVTQLPDFETVELFKDYPKTKLPTVCMATDAKFITFTEWIDKIKSNEFPLPFKKAA